MSQINVEKSIFGYFDTDIIFKRIWDFFVENFCWKNVFIWPISMLYNPFPKGFLLGNTFLMHCSVSLTVYGDYPDGKCFSHAGSKTPTLSTARRVQILSWSLCIHLDFCPLSALLSHFSIFGPFNSFHQLPQWPPQSLSSPTFCFWEDRPFLRDG